MALIDLFRYNDIKGWMSHRFADKHKQEVEEISVKLAHTRTDLIVELAFALTMVMAWAFVAWVFLKGYFNRDFLFVCVAATIFGIWEIAYHFFPHKSPTVKGMTDFGEGIARVDAVADRTVAFLVAPFMVTYIIDKTPQLQPSFWPGSKVHIAIVFIDIAIYLFIAIWRIRRMIGDRDQSQSPS